MIKLKEKEEKEVLKMADYFANYQYHHMRYEALKSEGLNLGTHQNKTLRSSISEERESWLEQLEILQNYMKFRPIGMALPKPSDFPFFHKIIELLEKIERGEMKEIAQIYLAYLMTIREKIKRKNKQEREANELLRDHSDAAFLVLLGSLQKKCEAAGFNEFTPQRCEIELDEDEEIELEEEPKND